MKTETAYYTSVQVVSCPPIVPSEGAVSIKPAALVIFMSLLTEADCSAGRRRSRAICLPLEFSRPWSPDATRKGSTCIVTLYTNLTQSDSGEVGIWLSNSGFE